VPIKDLTAGALEQVQLAERLARALGGSITLLHLHDPRLGSQEREQLRRDLEGWRPGSGPTGVGSGATVPLELDLRPRPGVEAAITEAAGRHDLVILRSQRRLVAGLPIPASDRTSRLLHQLDRPVLVISDPLH
jgi:hypothetical protein